MSALRGPSAFVRRSSSSVFISHFSFLLLISDFSSLPASYGRPASLFFFTFAFCLLPLRFAQGRLFALLSSSCRKGQG